MHVLLIGLRCSGKSTAGKLLARRLGWPFIDLDEKTAARMRCANAAEALRTEGEAAFRVAEMQALREVLAVREPTVIALGGGTPTAPGAPALLLDAQAGRVAVVAYLRATPELLAERLRADGEQSRPSLTGAPAADEVATLFLRRDPLYSRLADKIIDASGTPEEVVAQLASPGGASCAQP